MKTPILTNTKEDWFDNVENLRPLRGGRRAETLNEIASGVISVSAEDAEKKFCKDFERAKKSEDPLLIMYAFTNWFEEHFPTGKNYLFYPMLYKICTTFSIMEQYKNDERMLKLWVKLAESFPESAFAVMEFAYTKGSCRQCAKFYVRWSEMYQAIGHFNRAQEKLELGLTMCALPLPLLHNALDDLNTKLKLQAISKNNEDEEDDLINSDARNCRETLGKLRGLGRKHVAPIIRLTQGPPGKVLKSAQKTKKSKCFEVYVTESPLPNVEEQIFKTPLSRYNVIDDLKNDPDYHALFGFFDNREKADLQFTTTENLLTSSCKSIKFASISKTKNTKQQKLSIPHLNQNFEVYSDEVVDNNIVSDEKIVNIEKKLKNHSEKKSLIKPKLKIKKDVIGMSIEEAYARIIYNN